jgi:DNA ligase D-like protein (predicted 3'-phosphoesterase)
MTEKSASLDKYQAKRDFGKSPEPRGDSPARSSEQPIFVVQKHAASRLHYDFRLEVDGVLKSWAVPKGPSLNPADKRLAVMTEDHPLDYAGFEGTIPAEEYGGGTVIVWDRGTYENISGGGDAGNSAPPAMAESLEKGEVTIRLHGHKLAGGFALIHSRMGGKEENWLLIKRNDTSARSDVEVTAAQPESVLSGKTIEDLQDAD